MRPDLLRPSRYTAFALCIVLLGVSALLVAYDSTVEHAAKLALLSFDATLRSNLSVGLPIDLLRYEAGTLRADNLVTVEERNAYWRTLRDGYSAGLTALVDSLPAPPHHPEPEATA